MNPRAKGYIWRWATFVVLAVVGWIVFGVALRGPWHEMLLWGFASATIAGWVGEAAEAAMTGSYRRWEARRQLQVDRAVIERLEARRRERRRSS